MPIYFIAILTVVKISVKPEENPQLSNMPENLLYSETFKKVDPSSLNKERILVAPDDAHVQDIMTEAALVLQEIYGANSTSPTLQFFKNRSEAEASFSTNNSNILAGVVFGFANNMSTDYSGGGNLTYAIRYPKSDIPSTELKDAFVSQKSCRGQYESAEKGLYRGDCQVNKYLFTGFTGLQAAVDTAIIRKFGGNANFAPPNISVQMLPKPSYQPDSNYIQVISAIYFVIAYSPLISFLATNLVAEKEKKIKEGMRMMGLRSSVFWYVFTNLCLKIKN